MDSLKALQSTTTNQQPRVFIFIDHQPVCCGPWEGGTLLCSKKDISRGIFAFTYWHDSSWTDCLPLCTVHGLILSEELFAALQIQAIVLTSLAKLLNSLKSTRFWTDAPAGGLLCTVQAWFCSCAGYCFSIFYLLNNKCLFSNLLMFSLAVLSISLAYLTDLSSNGRLRNFGPFVILNLQPCIEG